MKSLFYKDQGKGPCLIFLHGFCETHEIWDDFIKPLTKKFRVITMDLPGFGKSEGISAPFSIDQVGDRVAKTLVTHGITNFLLIGHSLGGYVGLSLMQNHPTLLKAFGLFHSTIFADTPEKKENRNKVIDFIEKHGTSEFVDTFVPGLFFDKKHPAIDNVRRIVSGTKAQTIQQYAAAMRDRPDRTKLWKASAITKLVIAGIEDTTIPITSSIEVAKLGSKTSFYPLQKVAHMGFLEAENETQGIVERFAREIFVLTQN